MQWLKWINHNHYQIVAKSVVLLKILVVAHPLLISWRNSMLVVVSGIASADEWPFRQHWQSLSMLWSLPYDLHEGPWHQFLPLQLLADQSSLSVNIFSLGRPSAASPSQMTFLSSIRFRFSAHTAADLLVLECCLPHPTTPGTVLHPQCYPLQ